MSVEVLARLQESPFTRERLWRSGAVVGIAAGERLVVRDRGVFPWAGEAVDAWIGCTGKDLAAMLAGEVPAGEVVSRLGERDRAARLKQAHAVLVLAALGWAGPWPDAAADPAHVALVREALYDVEIGPSDGRAPLFPPGSPLPDVAIRVTDGVSARTVVTAGLAGPCELAVSLPPRADPAGALRPLRAAALYVAETGELPPARLDVNGLRLACGLHPAFPDGLPLPHRAAWLVRVAQEPGAPRR